MNHVLASFKTLFSLLERYFVKLSLPYCFTLMKFTVYLSLQAIQRLKEI